MTNFLESLYNICYSDQPTVIRKHAQVIGTIPDFHGQENLSFPRVSSSGELSFLLFTHVVLLVLSFILFLVRYFIFPQTQSLALVYFCMSFSHMGRTLCSN